MARVSSLGDGSVMRMHCTVSFAMDTSAVSGQGKYQSIVHPDSMPVETIYGHSTNTIMSAMY